MEREELFCWPSRTPTSSDFHCVGRSHQGKRHSSKETNEPGGKEKKMKTNGKTEEEAEEQAQLARNLATENEIEIKETHS